MDSVWRKAKPIEANVDSKVPLYRSHTGEVTLELCLMSIHNHSSYLFVYLFRSIRL